MKNEMTAFVTFALNHDPDFIKAAFGNNLHLQSKWDVIYSVMNGPTERYGRMVKFWSELSDNNRDRLSEYIRLKYIIGPVLKRAKDLSLTEDYKGCSVYVNRNGAGDYVIDDWYDPSCIAIFVNGVKQ